MFNQQHIKELFAKYLSNNCTEEEAKVLLDYIQDANNSTFVQSLLDEHLNDNPSDNRIFKQQAARIFKNLDLSIKDDLPTTTPSIKKSGWLRAVAIIACILLGAASIYIISHSFGKPMDEPAVVHDVLPGGNVATLVLSNGQQVELGELGLGDTKEDGGAIIKKFADGQISYTSIPNKHAGTNTIKTPRGGQYQVTLPDGSKVWLNAASSITYPAVFNNNERRVLLQGEGYFEITALIKNNKKVPFIVETGQQKIEVLGTRFNVKAYSDEKTIKTTLIEGHVKVITENESVILQPSQEFNLSSEGISTRRVDPEPAIDWKNGDFIFVEEDIRSIMRKLARWYNVEIIYEDELPMETRSGQISRNRNLSEVLRILELSGDIVFKIDRNTVRVYRK